MAISAVSAVVALPPGVAVAGGKSCHGHRATILGTRRADVLVGTKQRDVIQGRGGGDTIIGRRGDDIICGGTGHEMIDGGRGLDRVWGGRGNDACSASNRREHRLHRGCELHVTPPSPDGGGTPPSPSAGTVASPASTGAAAVGDVRVFGAFCDFRKISRMAFDATSPYPNGWIAWRQWVYKWIPGVGWGSQPRVYGGSVSYDGTPKNGWWLDQVAPAGFAGVLVPDLGGLGSWPTGTYYIWYQIMWWNGAGWVGPTNVPIRSYTIGAGSPIGSGIFNYQTWFCTV